MCLYNALKTSLQRVNISRLGCLNNIHFNKKKLIYRTVSFQPSIKYESRINLLKYKPFNAQMCFKSASSKHIAEKSLRLNNAINIRQMVQLLDRENGQDIVVIKVPEKLCYTDYFIIVGGTSERHLNSMAETANKYYKEKKNPDQKFSVIEGRDPSEDWKCLDLGNMVIHFMLPEAREKFQLEKLWLLGHEFDDQIHQQPTQDEIIKQLSMGDLNLFTMNQNTINAIENMDQSMWDFPDDVGDFLEEDGFFGNSPDVGDIFCKEKGSKSTFKNENDVDILSEDDDYVV